MNTKIKLALALGVAGLLVLSLVAGGWFVYTAYAQGGTPVAPNGTTPSGTPVAPNGTTPGTNGYPHYGGCMNNTAVLDLLKMTAADFETQRQAGQSLLTIATAKGVTEQALVGALMQPVETMHDWMGQNRPGFNDDQMDQAMRAQITTDIRETKFGTMTDYRILGGRGGMMGGWYGTPPNGSNGTAPNNSNGTWPGGMMGRGRGMMGGRGGMMGGTTY